jgi:hypothetical protein
MIVKEARLGMGYLPLQTHSADDVPGEVEHRRKHYRRASDLL